MQGLKSNNCIQYFSIKNKISIKNCINDNGINDNVNKNINKNINTIGNNINNNNINNNNNNNNNINNNNIRSNNNTNNKLSAFSLIELSIVLIIIGLLVAGITGGQSLIESARARAIINEMRDYERAVWTFKAAKGRYPGDVKNYGTFGQYSNYQNASYLNNQEYYAYKSTDFPSDVLAEFRKTAGSSAIPDYNSAPFLELYAEGIIDFKPLGNTLTSTKTYITKGTPNSKAVESSLIQFYYTGTYHQFQATPESNTLYHIGISKFGSIKESLVYQILGSSATNGISPKILKQVDVKLDDGEHWNGRFRGSCYGKKPSGESSNTTGYTDYEYAIENGKKCKYFIYAI